MGRIPLASPLSTIYFSEILFFCIFIFHCLRFVRLTEAARYPSSSSRSHQPLLHLVPPLACTPTGEVRAKGGDGGWGATAGEVTSGLGGGGDGG